MGSAILCRMRARVPLMLFALFTSCGTTALPPDAPNALLITIDTIRPDALGCYGGPPEVSPVLDELASQSVQYMNARTTVPITVPAHASMLTGLYPLRHRLRDNSSGRLPDSAHTLAELARERGFQTAAFVAARVLEHRVGLDQGFEVYDEPPRPDRIGHHIARRSAAEITASASDWMNQRDPERPFLLWLHFYDPHQPFEPEPEFLEQASGNLYHAEVAGMDHQIGRFLAQIDLDETLVIVVGDHGEAFGDHGEQTHGTYCYESTLRVPFLIRYPDGTQAGEQSQETVSVVDVFPTLVDALGLASPQKVDGESLWRRKVSADRGVYFESFYGWRHYGWSPLAGWARGTLKYLHSSNPELYDLELDPQEQSNLAAGTRHEIQPFREAIRQLAALPALTLESESPDEGHLRELAQLGYATGGSGDWDAPHPLDSSQLPGPIETRAEQELIDRGSLLAQTGREQEAVDVYREILQRNPRNLTALQELSYLLIGLDQHAEALPILLERLALPPERGLTHAKLGTCLEAAGDVEGAIRHLKLAVKLEPEHLRMLQHLVRLLGQQGRRQEAAPYLRRLMELRGTDGTK